MLKQRWLFLWLLTALPSMVYSLPEFSPISEERIKQYTQELKITLARRSLVRGTVMTVATMYQLYQLYAVGCYLLGKTPIIPALKEDVPSQSSVSYLSYLISIDFLKDTGKLTGTVCQLVAASMIAHKLLSPFIDAQSLTWFVTKKNPYFLSLHSMQLSAIVVARESLSPSPTVQLALIQADFIRSCNHVIEQTERLIAYMHATSIYFSKEERLHVHAMTDQMKRIVQTSIDTLENALKKNSYMFLSPTIEYMLQQLSIVLASFSTVEGSADQWLDYINSSGQALVSPISLPVA